MVPTFHERRSKDTHEVFGVSPDVLPDSYVDRGDLDEDLARLLSRRTHIALRGASKCGKSWLRRKVIPEAIVVQCRLGMKTVDIYRAALSELGIRLVISSNEGDGLTGRFEVQAEAGVGLLAKLGIKSSLESQETQSRTFAPVGHDLSDLRFIAELIIASGRRLVVEDFHYLSATERRAFAFDIKSLWDYGLFLVIVGIWNQQNLFLHLQPELAARVHEIPLEWSEPDLARIFTKGGGALNISFSRSIQARAIAECYKNAGILQRLILGTLDEAKVYSEPNQTLHFDREDQYVLACMSYVDELNTIYQRFADRLVAGIRRRRDKTGIYAYAMAVIFSDASDGDLLQGLSIDAIFEKAHARQPRIQRGNLHSVLSQIDGLQVDEEGRGLVFSYNQRDRVITVVDRQLLLYRKYRSGLWPWEGLIRETEAASRSE